MKKYTNLFKQFDKLDFATNIISKNVYDITLKNYSKPQKLLNFNEKLYKNTYKDWVN